MFTTDLAIQTARKHLFLESAIDDWARKACFQNTY